MDMYRRENAMVGVHRLDKPRFPEDFKKEDLMKSYTTITQRIQLNDHYSGNIQEGQIHMGDQFLTSDSLYKGCRDNQFILANRLIGSISKKSTFGEEFYMPIETSKFEVFKKLKEDELTNQVEVPNKSYSEFF
jgi:hypothetical protein